MKYLIFILIVPFILLNSSTYSRERENPHFNRNYQTQQIHRPEQTYHQNVNQTHNTQQMQQIYHPNTNINVGGAATRYQPNPAAFQRGYQTGAGAYNPNYYYPGTGGNPVYVIPNDGLLPYPSNPNQGQ